MSVQSYRTSSSALRTGINGLAMNSGIRRRHFWICLQMHARAIFFLVQIFLIILAAFAFYCYLLSPSWFIFNGQFYVLLFGYANFFGATFGIWALRLADKIHQNGCRIWEHCAVPPQLVIFPSYIVQIGDFVLLAYSLSCYFATWKSLDSEPEPLFIIFGLLIPIIIVMMTIMYVFAAEIDCFVYVAHRSRHWRVSQNPPTLLNIQAFTNERYKAESPRKKRTLLTDTQHEQERTKSSVSGGTQSSGSKKSCTVAEARIEVLPVRYGMDEPAPFFSEFINCSRKMGTSAFGSQLETVPEESSKSTASYP